MLTIRPETEADITTIRRLISQALQDDYHAWHDEHEIVEQLRDADQLAVSLVAVQGVDLVGFIAACEVAVPGGAPGWYSIGPLVVDPQRRTRGIGTDLVHAVLAQLRARGAAGVVVMGAPDFYGHFGFRRHPDAHYGPRLRDRGPLLSLPFTGPDLGAGTVTYWLKG